MLRNVALINSLRFLLLWVVFQHRFSHVTFLFQMLTLNPPLPWATWQELRSESNSNSEAILSKMLEAKVSRPMIKINRDKYSDGFSCHMSASQNMRRVELSFFLLNLLFGRSLLCVLSGPSSTLSPIS